MYITLGGRQFTFDTHGTHNGFHSRLSVNVKVHRSPTAPWRTRRRLERMCMVRNLKDYDIEIEAFEHTQEDWWDWAVDLAQERGLGTVFSTGRSGGYLVLDEWAPDRVEMCAEDYERECAHCGAAYAEHVEGHCLFDTTQFQSTEPEQIKLLEEIEYFFDTIRASLSDHAMHLYNDNFKHTIDRHWSEWRKDSYICEDRVSV